MTGTHDTVYASFYLQYFAVRYDSLIFLGKPGLTHALASFAPKSRGINEIRLDMSKNTTDSSRMHQFKCQTNAAARSPDL